MQSGLMLNLGCGRQTHPAWENIDFVALRPGVRVYDLRKPLPYPDGSCAAVYHSHVLEHFSPKTGDRFLSECGRVLRSGGILRVAVPDLEVIARLYLENLELAIQGDSVGERRYQWMVIELLDQMVRERSGGQMLNYWKQNPMPEEDFIVQRMGAEVRSVLAELRKQKDAPDAGDPDDKASVEFRKTGEVHKWMYDRYSLGESLKRAGFAKVEQRRAGQSAIADFSKTGFELDEEGAVRKPDSLFMEAKKPG